MMTIPDPGTSAPFITRVTVSPISARKTALPSSRFTLATFSLGLTAASLFARSVPAARSYNRLVLAAGGTLAAAPMTTAAANTANQTLRTIIPSRPSRRYQNVVFSLRYINVNKSHEVPAQK
jgi:hypothetical protein